MVIDQGRKFWTANGNFEQFKRTFFDSKTATQLLYGQFYDYILYFSKLVSAESRNMKMDHYLAIAET